MSDNILYEIQRSLGRIEGKQTQLQTEIRNGLKGLREEFSTHKQDDQRNFSSIRNSLKEHSTERETHLDAQDKRLNNIDLSIQGLQIEDKNSRKIGLYILSALGSLATLVGAATIAAVKYYFKVKT